MSQSPYSDDVRYSREYHFQFAPDEVGLPAITINRGVMTLDEIAAAEMENTRRQETSRIRDNIIGDSVDRTNVCFEELENLPDRNVSPPIDRTECPRYDAIKQFLIDKQRELALDTMDFEMPEHSMLNHITEMGVNITIDEWCKFLTIAHHAQELFEFVLAHLLSVTLLTSEQV
jgi:hypothetical protein